MKKPKVKLKGEDGNAFFILARCHKAWKKSGLNKEWWDKFKKEAESGDYDHLLQTVMEYFETK
jgi:hypothetical protein